MLRSHLVFVLVSLSLCLFLTTPAVALVVIDDFETGGYMVVDDALTPPTGVEVEQSGLSPSRTIGGVRHTRARANGQTGIASATLSPDAPDLIDDSVALVAPTLGTVVLTYDGIADGAASTGSGGALNAVLSGETAITVDVITPVSGANLQLRLADSGGSQLSSIVPVTTGTMTFLLSAFTNIDPTDVQAIALSFSNISTTTPITVSQILAVPEPGTAMLLALGLGLLARRTRRA